MPLVLFQPSVDAIPFYSLLVAVPSRPLPDDLAAQEKSEQFSAWRKDIQQGLMRQQIDETAPSFAGFIMQGSGVVQFRSRAGGATCLMAFSTPFRVADYARFRIQDRDRLQFLACSAKEAVDVVQQCREKAGTTHIAINRCPRSPTCPTINVSSINSVPDLVKAFTICAATDIAHTSLYRNYAQESARAGDLVRARDVALELVGHVTPHDAPTHLLLGKLAVRLGDEQLLREAKAFLEHLGEIALYGQLRLAEQDDHWTF
jgi:hypothetical protein